MAALHASAGHAGIAARPRRLEGSRRAFELAAAPVASRLLRHDYRPRAVSPHHHQHEGAPAYQRIPGLDRSPNIFEEGAPDLPRPAAVQQTLIKAFAVGGIGLHTGEYATVRVRPANAYEGRYFVRVPKGVASQHAPSTPKEVEYDVEDLVEAPVMDPEIEAMKLSLFTEYLKAQQGEGFKGNFFEFLQNVDLKDKEKLLQAQGPSALSSNWDFGQPDPIQALDSEAEEAIVADVFSYAPGIEACIRLEDSERRMIFGVQSLLSALEACGVDNARIEIEGGDELPIMDGSSLGWALHIQWAGLRPAPVPGSKDPAARLVLKPPEPFVVKPDDPECNSFIQFVPGSRCLLSVGIDHSDIAEVIGKQWLTWSPFENKHYRFELAGAREFVESPELAVAMREHGYLLGGTDQVVMVAFGDRWWDAQLVRYVDDEPVRHVLADVIGGLSLNSFNGHSGLPIGHITAYKPTHDLVHKLVKALRESTRDEDWVPIAEVVPPTDV